MQHAAAHIIVLSIQIHANTRMALCASWRIRYKNLRWNSIKKLKFISKAALRHTHTQPHWQRTALQRPKIYPLYTKVLFNAKNVWRFRSTLGLLLSTTTSVRGICISLYFFIYYAFFAQQQNFKPTLCAQITEIGLVCARECVCVRARAAAANKSRKSKIYI